MRLFSKFQRKIAGFGYYGSDESDPDENWHLPKDGESKDQHRTRVTQEVDRRQRRQERIDRGLPPEEVVKEEKILPRRKDFSKSEFEALPGVMQQAIEKNERRIQISISPSLQKAKDKSKKEWESFARLHNEIATTKTDPRSGRERDRPKAKRDYRLPESGQIIPGRYQLPTGTDPDQWRDLFDDIEGTYRFRSPIFPSTPGIEVPDSAAIRADRRLKQTELFDDARKKYDPETGTISNSTTQDITLDNPREKKPKILKGIKVFNRARTSQREFPTFDQYVESGTDHVIHDLEGTPHSLSVLARHAHLANQETGSHYLEHSDFKVTATMPQWEKIKGLTDEEGRLVHHAVLQNASLRVRYTSKRGSSPRKLVLADSEIPDPHEHGEEGARELLKKLGSDVSLEQIRESWAKPEPFDGLHDVPGSRVAPEKSKTVDSDGNSSTELKLPYLGDVNRIVAQTAGLPETLTNTGLEEVSGNGQKRTKLDLIWENEKGEKRRFSDYLPHIQDTNGGIARLKDPVPETGPYLRSKLDPTTASTSEVDDLLTTALGPERVKKYSENGVGAILSLPERIRDKSTGVELARRLYGTSSVQGLAQGHVQIPGLDDLGLHGIQVEHQRNGETTKSSLERFLQLHTAAENARKGKSTLVSPAYSTIEDIQNLISHATNGEIRRVEDYTRLHLGDSPERHKAIDLGIGGELLPLRSQKWGENTLYSRNRHPDTQTTRNLADLFTAMGGDNLYTTQGPIPTLKEKTLDELVNKSTGGTHKTAQEYRDALTAAVEGDGDLTPFIDHHVFVNGQNQVVPPRKSPLPRKMRSTLSGLLGIKTMPKIAEDAFPLAAYFRPALLERDDLGHVRLPDRAVRHVEVPAPDFAGMERDSHTRPLLSTADQDNRGIANFGRPRIDTATGSIIALPRHTRSYSEQPMWLTGNEEHICPQCSSSTCMRCAKQVSRNKIDPKTQTHKEEFMGECDNLLKSSGTYEPL